MRQNQGYLVRLEGAKVWGWQLRWGGRIYVSPGGSRTHGRYRSKLFSDSKHGNSPAKAMTAALGFAARQRIRMVSR